MARPKETQLDNPAHFCRSRAADGRSAASKKGDTIVIGEGLRPETHFFHYDGNGNIILHDSFDLTDPSWGLRYTGYPEQPVIVGRTEVMLEVYRTLLKIASYQVPVLIQGETGTGKELVARTLISGKGGPFEAVNCALPMDGVTFEDTLFGRADKVIGGAPGRPGAFQKANNGTLFLDDVDSLSLDQQARLRRVIESQVVYRVGASQGDKVNVRIICASNQDVDALVGQGRFRKDLHYRIKGIQICLAPLHARKDDIPLLVTYFFLRNLPGSPRKVKVITSEAMRELHSYDWPGNVRELAKVIEKALILEDGPTVRPEEFDLPKNSSAPISGLVRHRTITETTRSRQQARTENIESLLRQYPGARTRQLANLTGYSVRTIERRLEAPQYEGRVRRQKDPIDKRRIQYYLC